MYIIFNSHAGMYQQLFYKCSILYSTSSDISECDHCGHYTEYSDCYNVLLYPQKVHKDQ